MIPAELGSRMLAKGIADSMLRAGGKLPAKVHVAGVWAAILGTAAFAVIIGGVAAIAMGAVQ